MACKIIIPARKGSKGWPRKNQLLFDYTAELIKEYYKHVYVTSDDDFILHEACSKNFCCRTRPKELCTDTANLRDVLKDTIDYFSFDENDIVMMLYLTYPYRQIEHIEKAYKIFTKNNHKSLLCREPVATHPYMCIQKQNGKWTQLIKHDLYRRQDYPNVWEISHYIAMFRVNELDKLNKNLYNKDTFFMEIERQTDCDKKEDFK